MYPNEVAGLVLVDSAYENDEPDVRMRVADPALKRLLPVQAQNIVAGVWPYLGRLGLVRLLSDENASIDEGKVRSESAEQVRAIRTFGDLPLRVITGGRFVSAGGDAAELRKASAFHDAWVNDIQANLARLSTNGRQIVVPTSGHAVPYEAPEIISSSIEAMIPSLKERPESPPAPNASTGP